MKRDKNKEAARRYAPPADGSSTVAKIAAIYVRPWTGPHIYSGRRWLRCRQPARL